MSICHTICLSVNLSILLSLNVSICIPLTILLQSWIVNAYDNRCMLVTVCVLKLCPVFAFIHQHCISMSREEARNKKIKDSFTIKRSWLDQLYIKHYPGTNCVLMFFDYSFGYCWHLLMHSASVNDSISDCILSWHN